MACKKCGECCKWVAILIDDLSEDGKRWAKFHGQKVVKKKEQKVLFIPNRCNHLGDDNKCKIYADRPDMCAIVPNVDCTIFQPEECKYFEDEASI